ncbi:MAG: hypothetical protein KGZ45_02960 [Clostridium sp.]|nr:hypothetical protein [Clostridium sp.]
MNKHIFLVCVLMVLSSLSVSFAENGFDIPSSISSPANLLRSDNRFINRHDKSIRSYEKIQEHLSKENASPYGGGFIDEDGFLNIAMVGNVESNANILAHQKVLLNLTNNPAIKFVEAEYTLGELEDIVDIFDAQMFYDLEQQGIKVAYVEIIQKENSVYIYIANLKDLSEDQITIVRNLVDNHPAVKIAKGGEVIGRNATSPNTMHDPLIGGVRGRWKGISESTVSFSALTTNGRPAAITSGHGSPPENEIYYQLFDEQPLGPVIENPRGSIWVTRYSDTALVQLNSFNTSPSHPNYGNRRRVTGEILIQGSTVRRPVNGTRNVNSQPEGASISYFSMTTNREVAGVIRAKGVTTQISGFATLRDQVRIEQYKDALNGDSGAPVLNRWSAGGWFIYGVYSGSDRINPRIGFYSPYCGITRDLSKFLRPVWAGETYQ